MYGVYNAAEKGYIDIVKYLHENRKEGCSANAMGRAAMFGHFDVVKWLYENRTEGCINNDIGNTLHYGYNDIFEFLKEHYGYTPQSTIYKSLSS
jgi:hypothetical protein